jgi:hypothetical protein
MISSDLLESIRYCPAVVTVRYCSVEELRSSDAFVGLSVPANVACQ